MSASVVKRHCKYVCCKSTMTEGFRKRLLA
uniref:Uncharacterized protein n=1 Tax=Anguilla anguilla TaxID=7936 RepID=A0A0E9RFU0_ANGAN